MSNDIIEAKIKKYKRYISNLQWHLDVNGKFVLDDDKKRITERISDMYEMISDLQQIAENSIANIDNQ